MANYIDNWFAEPIESSSDISMAVRALGECSADLVINRDIKRVMADPLQFIDYLRCKRTIAKHTRDAFDPSAHGYDWHEWRQWEVRRAEASAIQSAFKREHS